MMVMMVSTHLYELIQYAAKTYNHYGDVKPDNYPNLETFIGVAMGAIILGVACGSIPVKMLDDLTKRDELKGMFGIMQTDEDGELEAKRLSDDTIIATSKPASGSVGLSPTGKRINVRMSNN